MPTAPFGSSYVAERCGQSLAKLSDHVFPESVWKAFGEHVREDREEEESKAKGEGRKRHFGSLLGRSWGLLRASWAFFGSLF